MSDLELANKSFNSDGAAGLVPVGYAEKAMASLMQLHSEVLEEKERRVDLHRRLMEKEQAVAELKMYVKMLEEKLARGAQGPGMEAPPAVVAQAPLRRPEAPPVPPRPPAVARQAPREVAAPALLNHPRPERMRPAQDGWKAW